MASELFDLSDEIQIIDQAPDRYGIEPEEAFFMCQTCGMVAAVVSVFEVERIEKGCVVTAFGKIAIHSIEIYEAKAGSFVSLSVQPIEDRAQSTPECVFTGPASQPVTWEGVVKHVFRNERSILWMTDFAERLRTEWQKFLDVRRDRLVF